MTIPHSYYELLGVSKSVDSASLRKAFRSLSKSLHPDTTSLPVDEAAIRFQEICEAYELLSDPILRKRYDEQLLNQEMEQNVWKRQVEDKNLSGQNSRFITEVRRPLSGGELFSLFLLTIALLFSLLLGLGFAFVQGRELQVLPSWLILDQTIGTFLSQFP